MSGDSSVEYYYAVGKKRLGPVGMSDLKNLALSGELNRSDKVWNKGMDKWTSAGEVDEIFADLPRDLGDVQEASNSSELKRSSVRRSPSIPQRTRTAALLFAVVAAVAFLCSRQYWQSQLDQLERLRSGIAYNARRGFDGTVVGLFPGQ